MALKALKLAEDLFPGVRLVVCVFVTLPPLVKEIFETQLEKHETRLHFTQMVVHLKKKKKTSSVWK